MIRVGFLLNYDHQSWLGGFNVIINLFRSINLIKKKRLIPILIVPIYFKKYYKKYNIPKDQIIFTNLFTEQKLSSKLINKIRIFLFGKSQISQKINIEYLTKLLTINDKDWSDHRLSSKRERGLVNSLGLTWNTKNLKFNINIYNQDYTLDKAEIEKSFGLSFFSSMKF